MDSALRKGLFFFAIALILSSGVSATNNPQCGACQCAIPDQGLINLESLTSFKTGARFKEEYKDENKTSSWVTYNPCRPFAGDEECNEAAACFQEEGVYTGIMHTSMFGKQENAEWSKDLGSITYSFKERKFVVTLVCNKTVVNDTFVITNVSATQIKTELTSKCACPGECPPDVTPASSPKSSISTGSIILILFFTLVILYLVGGIIYNKIMNGATGRELIPNVEFWTALPKLIMDGVAFVCNCCGKRRSTPDYDNNI